MHQDKQRHTHVHLVGIKGVAMAALAVYLSESGFRVTGSDVPEDFPTQDELRAAGIRVLTGFDASRMTGKTKPDIVYYTGAHGGRDNAEVAAAIAEGIPVSAHGVALGTVMNGSRQIVVSGSHGKTTTSAMIATILVHANLQPSYAIGCGSISGLGAAGHKGSGPWFVAEGDEYVTDPQHDPTPRFHWLSPEILVVTNIDYDHPDAYANLQAVQQAFLAAQHKSAMTIVNADDPNSRVLLNGNAVVTFGRSPAAEYRIVHIGEGLERMFFTLEERGVALGEFTLKVPGRHNVSNAVAALIAARGAGVSWDAAREGLLAFTGTKRRFEKLATADGVTYYDDYAHHPAEISATLSAARAWYPDRRIIAVFQPHTYSRTKALASEFAGCFTDADSVVLTEIYASARETDTLGMTGMKLASDVSARHTGVVFCADAVALSRWLGEHTRPGDVVVFMGAGDIYNWERPMIARMRSGARV